MSKAGQYNYKGINSQAWAAMSLFLQYLRDPRFSTIQLEAENFEDFNLIFSDGKKIICESKDRSEKFSYPHLKKILENISKMGVLNEQDEILIICSNANEKLISEVRPVKYFEQLQNKFISKGYAKSLLPMLPKVKFWVVPPSFNEKIIYALFSELINFWLPPEDIERFVDSILIQKIYKGSASGAIYSRANILKDINDLARGVRENSVYRDDLVKREKQFKELEMALNKPNHFIWRVPKELSAFSTDFERLAFVRDRLINKQNELVLKNWDPLWRLNKVRYFTFGIFDIFEKNLHSDQNRKYVLNYIKKYAKTTRGFYQVDFFSTEVVKIVTKIIDGNDGKKYLKDAFEIVKKLISNKENEFFYLKNEGPDHTLWEKEEICKLIHKIYNQADSDSKQRIFGLLISTFNITEDEGDFNHHAPEEVYSIINEWLNEDFLGRFPTLVRIISNQYVKFYKKFVSRIKFTGWEHMGGGTSSSGHDFKVSDRHFIDFILGPAIKKYYDGTKDKNLAWEFIVKKCISKTRDVNKDRPDFLNRAVITIILDRYEDNDGVILNEAFKILKEFILSRKGIPHKSDLIYQWLRHRPRLSDDKKWKLVEIMTKKYGFPVSIFLEEIVSQLAKKGYGEAKNELKRWLDNPKYYERFRIEINIVQNVRALLDNDFNFAVELFETFIWNEKFIQEYDSFETYELAALLYDILKKNHDKGLEIIKKLAGEKTLTKNQQILLCFSLFNYRGNDKSDELDLLMKVYDEFLIELLFGVSDKKKAETLYNLSRESQEIFKGLSEKICSKITSSQAREALAQFADRLVANKKIKEALGVVKVFVNDPDPYLPRNNPEDPEDKYNEHKMILEGKEPGTITSVRGWCAWVLMKCAVPLGRDYIGEIIALTERLAKDENWYVKHMACFALSQLAGNSLTVMPDNKEMMFFGKDKEEALGRAKRVQRIAFDLLKDLDGAGNAVKDALAKSVVAAFDRARALNGEDALVLINTLKKFPSEAIVEAMPLFIYFAEFRQDHFKDWKWQIPGYYDDLGNFDNKPFQDIAEELIKRGDPKINWAFAVEMEKIARDLVPGSENEGKMLEIIFRYFNLLSQGYNHDFFNVIYMTIKDGIGRKNHFDKWYGLYKICLDKEKNYYDKNFKQEKTPEMSWYPSYYNEDILALLYQQGEKDKFLEIFNIITQFPKELEIHDSEKIIALLKEFPKTDTKVKTIIGRLYERNHSRYYELKNQWLA